MDLSLLLTFSPLTNELVWRDNHGALLQACENWYLSNLLGHAETAIRQSIEID